MSGEELRRLENSEQAAAAGPAQGSRISGFYRLSVEQRLAFLARRFGLSNEEVASLRDGRALRIEHAVNMVENAVGVMGMPLGLGLNFLVDGKEYIVPMAIEEASIIAAASKAALIIRGGGGFVSKVSEPVMIGQVQVLDVKDPEAAMQRLHARSAEIIAMANSTNRRMLERGGGAFAIETRIVDGGEGVGLMLVLHLLIDVREAMGANTVNYSCEAAGPLVEEITGGRVNLRILSNYADRRMASASFRLPIERLRIEGYSGAEVAQRMLEASRFAWADPYRATTHNKGIFNGIGAAALALGQDWRAIEAGGHAYACRDGQYRALATYRIEGDSLVGEIALPMQVGWVGGAVNSHPAVGILRRISGVQSSSELAALMAAVGLGQNFAACLALSTVGIQSGHMALHARSVALSVGVPAVDVEEVAREMIRRGEVKVSVAEEIHRRMQQKRQRVEPGTELPVELRVPGKVVLFGEHSVVYGYPGITATVDVGLKVSISHDPDGPRFIAPRFRQLFGEAQLPEERELDFRLFSQAVERALEMFSLSNAPIAIEVESELVPGMGLGSSAAFSVALCAALRRYKGEHFDLRFDDELLEQAQQLESIFHGSPSGMDAATVMNGGVLWFRRGEPREILPVRLSVPLAGIVLIVQEGARTIELVQQVEQSRGMNPARVDGIMAEIGELTVRAGRALGSGKLEEVGELMLRNHALLCRLGVSTPELDRAVEDLMERGALGAKLTGAGGGGAVIALVRPEERYRLMGELQKSYPLVFPFDLA